MLEGRRLPGEFGQIRRFTRRSRRKKAQMVFQILGHALELQPVIAGGGVPGGGNQPGIIIEEGADQVSERLLIPFEPSEDLRAVEHALPVVVGRLDGAGPTGTWSNPSMVSKSC